MNRTHAEELARLAAMRDDDGQTWDLSPEDRQAIKVVLEWLWIVEREADRLQKELRAEKDRCREECMRVADQVRKNLGY